LRVPLLLLLLLQVIKEVLRYRPPAPMVPQVAMKPFKLNDSYTVRAGWLS
jgi:cytochrome P450 family 710 subfamily A protein